MKARAIVTVALLGLLVGCAPSTPAASTATVTVGNRQFQVEVADTADEQRAGLSGRAEVPEGTGIAAFWRAVTQQSDDFAHLIETTPVNIDQWHAASERYAAGEDGDDLTLGFATFFLNRTNRSGILDARPIGGLNQTGKWKIDARYNVPGLAERVRTIGTLNDHITVRQVDGLTFLESLEPLGDDVLVYADPPYVVQGKELYLNAFDDGDHQALADVLLGAPYPWILTYDDEQLIWQDLYGSERCARFNITHTAQINHLGKETVVYGPSLEVPQGIEITPGVQASWVG